MRDLTGPLNVSSPQAFFNSMYSEVLVFSDKYVFS